MNRSPAGINVHRFLEGYGIKVLQYHLKRDPRPANVVYGGREVARLMKKDIERTGTTIRCIQASNPTCFDDLSLWSTYRVICVHFPHSEARDAIRAFSGIDIAEVKKTAHRLSIGVGGALTKQSAAISIELARAIFIKETAA